MTEEDYNLKRIEELLIELSEEAEERTDIELPKNIKYMIIDCNIERHSFDDPIKTNLIRINKQHICDSIKERLGYSFVKSVYTEITDEDWDIIHEFIKNEKLACMISIRSGRHKS